MTGYEEWSRAGWAAHLPGVPDIPAFVAGLGEATIPGLAAASADRVPDRVALSIDGEQITHADTERRRRPGRRLARGPASGPGRPGAAGRPVQPRLRALLPGRAPRGRRGRARQPGLHRRGTRAPGHRLRRGGRVRGQRPRAAARRAAARAADRRSRPRSPPGRRDSTAIVPGPDDTALLAYTSGTTGRPKAVPLTHRALLTSIRVAMASWGWREDDVLAHALPLFHQHGLGGVHAVLIAGGTAHIGSRFTAAGPGRRRAPAPRHRAVRRPHHVPGTPR